MDGLAVNSGLAVLPALGSQRLMSLLVPLRSLLPFGDVSNDSLWNPLGNKGHDRV